nr:homeobox protein BEL1 homolog [Coffea arabica]
MPIPGGEEKTRAMVTTTGYCFSDPSNVNPSIQTHIVTQLQSFESNPEIYNLTTGMEMIGFPSKNLQPTSHDNNSVMWKEFFGKPSGNHHHHYQAGGASSSKTINEPSSASDQFYQQDFSATGKPDFSTGISDTASQESLMVTQDHHNQSSAAWHVNRSVLLGDPSLRVVFPCEGNERPSQGLSLSLGSSNNPSTIGLQSFELKHQDDMRFAPSTSRDGQFIGKSLNIQQQQQMMEDGFLGKAANLHHQGLFQIRSSKYLAPAQELLNEFCNLETKQTDRTSKLKLHKTSQWQDQENASNPSKMQSLYSLDLMELQKRKAKLLQMLEEVDRRYKHYCNQMKAVVSSFEAVAGNGAAAVYSALASKAMSRHFRCLRDGIVGQIKATKKALGEKDTAAPGTTRGETPRLRLLDQALRQQRAFQQMSMMESHPWRPQRGLPERAVSVLRAWLFEHFLHPYPTDVDKHILARQTGLSRSQVSNWFINARVRLWKPMVEEMYTEETKEEENLGESLDEGPAKGGLDDHHNPHHQSRADQDQKPTPDQLVRIDSECLSSIINNPEKNDSKSSKSLHQDDHNLQHIQHHSFSRVSDSFGAVELDFSSYNHHSAGALSYENAHQTYAAGASGSGSGSGGSGTGGGVSLTLGLQQHSGGGVSLAFSPASQNSLFYSREHMEDCPPVQYSLLDSEGQNLPYRNLMGAQLLHDLAG